VEETGIARIRARRAVRRGYLFAIFNSLEIILI
jgi:hypothetical protein